MKISELAKNLLPKDVPCTIYANNPFEEAMKKGEVMSRGPIVYEGEGIHITDSMSVEEVFTFYEKQAPWAVEGAEVVLKEEGVLKKTEKISDKLFVSFMISHELGHWVQRRNRDFEGNIKEMKARAESNKLLGQIGEKAREILETKRFMDKGFDITRQVGFSQGFEKLLIEFYELKKEQGLKHREIPSEQATDEYAAKYLAKRIKG